MPRAQAAEPGLPHLLETQGHCAPSHTSQCHLSAGALAHCSRTRVSVGGAPRTASACLSLTGREERALHFSVCGSAIWGRLLGKHDCCSDARPAQLDPGGGKPSALGKRPGRAGGEPAGTRAGSRGAEQAMPRHGTRQQHAAGLAGAWPRGAGCVSGLDGPEAGGGRGERDGWAPQRAPAPCKSR